MYAYALNELAWAIARERQEDARQARPHAVRPQEKEPLRSRVARALVSLGKQLDSTVEISQ